MGNVSVKFSKNSTFTPDQMSVISTIISAVNQNQDSISPTRMQSFVVTNSPGDYPVQKTINYALQFSYFGGLTTDDGKTMFINTNSTQDPIGAFFHELTHELFPGVPGVMVQAHTPEWYANEIATLANLYAVNDDIKNLVDSGKLSINRSDIPSNDPVGYVTHLGLPASIVHNAPQCFLAGTPVLMADGSEKPIEEIKPGDEVLAFDGGDKQGLGPTVSKKVTRLFRNVTKSIIDLRGLRMTPGHMVLSDNGEWLTIAEVLRNDRGIVEERKTGAVLVRARTGAVIGSLEDTPIRVC